MQTILTENVSSVVLAETVLELYRWVWPLCLELKKVIVNEAFILHNVRHASSSWEMHVIIAQKQLSRIGRRGE